MVAKAGREGSEMGDHESLSISGGPTPPIAARERGRLLLVLMIFVVCLGVVCFGQVPAAQGLGQLLDADIG